MLTRASCAKAVVAANAANRAASNVMRCRYPNCFIVTLLIVERIKMHTNCFLRALIWSAGRLKALITNDSWIGLALQPTNFAYRQDYAVTFTELRNRGNEGPRCECSCRLPKDRMQQHLTHSSDRFLAMGLAAASTAAMFYVGLYQSRALRHLWCPVFNKGCEAVADAAFAKPFGIPDGYIAVALYVAMILLLLASLATLANFLGVRDMANLGSFCFYCIFTTALSPVLLWAVWRLR